MNGAWIFQTVLFLASAVVSAILGYLPGVKQQKKQALREYITETAGVMHPSLFSEMYGKFVLTIHNSY